LEQWKRPHLKEVISRRIFLRLELRNRKEKAMMSLEDLKVNIKNSIMRKGEKEIQMRL
jgi:hypothetical protein